MLGRSKLICVLLNKSAKIRTQPVCQKLSANKTANDGSGKTKRHHDYEFVLRAHNVRYPIPGHSQTSSK